MAYNHKEFIDRLEKRRDSRAYERVVKDLGNDTVIVACLYPDEDMNSTDLYGEWENNMAEWRIDRKDQIFYGDYISREYRYITRSEKRAVERATKRAAKDRFQLDEDSDHQADMNVYRQGNYTTVLFEGYQILSDDVWVNSRFDSWRDARYFVPPIENYKGTPEAELIQYCLQDHHRMEELCNDEWRPAYATATAYYKGHEIGDESLGGFEAEYGMSDDWITETMDMLNIEAARQAKFEELKAELTDLEA